MKKSTLVLLSICVWGRNLDGMLRSKDQKIIMTAALVPDADPRSQARMEQYIKAFQSLNQYAAGEDAYVVEALRTQGPTFLEKFIDKDKVFYSTANDLSLKNRGLNEALTLLEALAHFNFDAETLIIKFTGRYHLLSNHFFNIIKENPGYDAYLQKFPEGKIGLVAAAMKCKFWKEAYESLDYATLERDNVLLEKALGDFIAAKIQAGEIKVLWIEKADIGGDNFGTTTFSSVVPVAPSAAPGQTIIKF